MTDPFDFLPPRPEGQQPTDPQTAAQPAEPLSRRAAREAAAGGAAGAVAGASARRGEAGTPRKGGLLGAIAKHPNAWLFSALAVAFVLLGTGSIFAGIAAGSSPASAVVPTPTTTTAAPRPVPTAVSNATHLRTCSIAGQAADPNLFTLEGSVINATSGEVLFDRSGSKASPPGSVIKTLTAAAGLAVLGPDYQFTTQVYEGSTPGSIVLVGGGDPTLSAVPAGQESVYKGAPKLSDLASQVQAKWASLHPDPDADGGQITSLILDATMWNSSDNWDPTWPRTEQTQGYQPEITALMVDGDRANPKAQTSPRGNDPVGHAGSAFVSALGLSGVKTSTGSAIPGKQLLGEVKSQPLKTLIGQMLPNSDNTLAEMIARVTSKVGGRDGSSSSLAQVIPNALAQYDLPVTGLVIKDGSGESNADGVPTAFVAQLMAKIAAGDKNLSVISDGMPVAGKSGTLASRFSGANAIARGAVIAKTGTILKVDALGGIIHAADGTTLTFAFYSSGAVNSRTLTALDTLTTAAFSCGNNLSNN